MKEEEKILSIYNRKELLRYFEQTEIERILLQKENKDLKSQLANIKYLNADEVRNKLRETYVSTTLMINKEGVVNIEGLMDCFAQAICKLAIDIDRDKINQELLDQLYRFEGVMGKYECQHGGMECNFQTAFHRLIRAEIDEIIKAIRGEE